MSNQCEQAPSETRGERRTQPKRWSTSRLVRVLAAIAITAWLVEPLTDVVLLVFAGILVAVFWSGIGAFVARHLRLAQRLATALCILSFVALGGVTAWLVTPELARQTEELRETLPKAAGKLLAAASKYPGVSRMVDEMGSVGDVLSSRETLSRAKGFLSSTAGALTSLLALSFIGLFVAFEPGMYRTGLLRLFPPARRARLAEVMTEAGHALHLWMMTKIVAMAVVGAATWFGLWLLGIPLAFALGLLSALLTFVPNFGPVIAVVPPMLLALAESPTTALFVAALYLGIQVVESYLITPLMERKTMSLPPALTIFAQLALGTIAGGLGVIIATPLVVVLIVFTVTPPRGAS
jgi:predicted PurR-regulated permease PerM